MNLKSLKCPNCKADLSVDDGLDTFYCQYCGGKIILEGQSENAYDAKVKIKNMQHEENMQDKYYEHEKAKLNVEKVKEKGAIVMFLAMVFLLLIMVGFSSFTFGLKSKKLEKQLNNTVDEIIIDIKNEDFVSAYIKANTLYWNESLSSDGVEKWDATREEVLKQIKEAEKEAK